MFNKYNYIGIKDRIGFDGSTSKKRKTTQCTCGIMTYDKDGECAVCKVEKRFTDFVLKGISMSRYPLLRSLTRREYT
jgi:hypothetical protein